MRNIKNFRRWRKKFFSNLINQIHRRERHRRWLNRHPYYTTYNNAKRRCEERTNIEYSNYGGRGIKFLFKSYDEFIRALGPRPLGKTLDRIDNDGNYEPDNCRWATRSEQNYNCRRRKRMDKDACATTDNRQPYHIVDGKLLTQKEWQEKTAQKVKA